MNTIEAPRMFRTKSLNHNWDFGQANNFIVLTLHGTIFLKNVYTPVQHIDGKVTVVYEDGRSETIRDVTDFYIVDGVVTCSR